MGFIEDKKLFNDTKNILNNEFSSLETNDENIDFLLKNSIHSKKWYYIYKHIYNTIVILFIIQCIFTLFNIHNCLVYGNYKLLIINVSLCAILYVLKDFTDAKKQIYDNRFFLYYNEYLRILENKKSADLSTLHR